MKNILSIILIFTIGCLSAQDFNRWAISGEFGGHSTADASATDVNPWEHYGLDVRYNINPKFGLSVNLGYDDMDLLNFVNVPVNTKYYRANLEANVNIFKILDLDNNFMTMIAHGGPGVSKFYQNNDYYGGEIVFNLSGGVSALFKLSRVVALKADWTTTINTNQERTLDGYSPITNTQTNAIINNFSGGLVFYLGKKDKHADWFVPEPVVPKQITIDNTKTIVEKPQIHNHYDTPTVPQNEYVYFKHDSYVIDKDGLANIEKAVANAKTRITIVAYCSNIGSYEYNMKLATNRATAVKEKIDGLGFTGSIVFKLIGIDNDRDTVVYDMARRAVLISE